MTTDIQIIADPITPLLISVDTPDLSSTKLVYNDEYLLRKNFKVFHQGGRRYLTNFRRKDGVEVSPELYVKLVNVAAVIFARVIDKSMLGQAFKEDAAEIAALADSMNIFVLMEGKTMVQLRRVGRRAMAVATGVDYSHAGLSIGVDNKGPFNASNVLKKAATVFGPLMVQVDGQAAIFDLLDEGDPDPYGTAGMRDVITDVVAKNESKLLQLPQRSHKTFVRAL